MVATGPLAETYRARPLHSPKEKGAAYALKLFRRERQDDARAVRLFRREALVGRTVRHPHLVSVLSASVRKPPFYVVMPWLPGATLAARLARGWQPHLPVALWIARQTAEALDGLHQAGWMHGDVKPDNIHLSPDGHVTLLDLGFARRPDEAWAGADPCVLGTGAYMAPESLSAARRPDIRSDLYSLGVVLFEMLAGRRPLEGRTLAETAALHRQTRPPDLRRLVPHLPGAAARLVREMLAKEPLRRPQSPREAIDRLVALEVFTFAERHGA